MNEAPDLLEKEKNLFLFLLPFLDVLNTADSFFFLCRIAREVLTFLKGSGQFRRSEAKGKKKKKKRCLEPVMIIRSRRGQILIFLFPFFLSLSLFFSLLKDRLLLLDVLLLFCTNTIPPPPP